MRFVAYLCVCIHAYIYIYSIIAGFYVFTSKGKRLHTRTHSSENSSKMSWGIHWDMPLNSTGKVTFRWKMPLEKWKCVGRCHWKSIGKWHWKSTMISEVSISDAQFLNMLRIWNSRALTQADSQFQVLLPSRSCSLLENYNTEHSFLELKRTHVPWKKATLALLGFGRLRKQIGILRTLRPKELTGEKNLAHTAMPTPNLPTNITPANIAWLELSGKSPMGLGIPPLKFKIVLESNPLKSTMFARRLGVQWTRSVLLTCSLKISQRSEPKTKLMQQSLEVVV